MVLKQLVLSNFRNINDTDLELSDGCNLICGENGSGKTSLLESVYLYWNGRSFRTSRLNDIVNDDKDEVLIRGYVEENSQTIPFGFQYSKSRKERMYRYNSNGIKRSSDLASLLPVYYFSPQSENLISGSPGARRSLLFWYLFHVEPTFKYQYSSLQKAVKQRNRLLRSGGENSEYEFWESQIFELSCTLKQLTEARIELLKDLFKKECKDTNFAMVDCQKLVDRIDGVSVKYSWNKNEELKIALEEKREYESKLGYTTLGYQKCEFSLDTKLNKRNFSRGEEKALSLILMVSILRSIYVTTKNSILFLIDDLSAELDSQFIKGLLMKLATLPLQLFITTLTKDSLVELVNEHFSNSKMFHVKQGVVVEEQNV